MLLVTQTWNGDMARSRPDMESRLRCYCHATNALLEGFGKGTMLGELYEHQSDIGFCLSHQDFPEHTILLIITTLSHHHQLRDLLWK